MRVPPDSALSRRRFLTTTAAGLAGCATAAAIPAAAAQAPKAASPAQPGPAPAAPAAKAPPPQPAAPPAGAAAAPAITTQTIAEAEKLVDVTYTPAERALMVTDFVRPNTFDPLRARRKHQLPETMAPAMRLDTGAPPPRAGRA